MNKNKHVRCYFDIETSLDMSVTVAGMYYETGKIVQLVGEEITGKALKELFLNTIVYTYNGSRFDIPVVKDKIGLDINNIAPTHDLMYDCWSNNLYGGLKKVEKQLGISREITDVDGREALWLWERYQRGDKKSLEILLKYNSEDVTNLEVLRKKLNVK
ncbi:ribonuclease H-like domain-containing protein [Elusimicrobiota bacterium]